MSFGQPDIIALSYQLKDVSKSHQGTKLLHEWCILLNGTKHIITVYHSLTSGKVVIAVDGTNVVETEVLIGGQPFSNTYDFMIQNRKGQVRHSRDSCELVVDGKTFAQLYEQLGRDIESGKINLTESLKKSRHGHQKKPEDSKKNENMYPSLGGSSWNKPDSGIRKTSEEHIQYQLQQGPEEIVSSPRYNHGEIGKQPYNNLAYPTNKPISPRHNIQPPISPRGQNFQQPLYQPQMPAYPQPPVVPPIEPFQNPMYHPSPRSPYRRQNSPNPYQQPYNQPFGQPNPNSMRQGSPLPNGGQQFYNPLQYSPSNQQYPQQYTSPGAQQFKPPSPLPPPISPRSPDMFNDPQALNIMASKVVQLLNSASQKREKSPRPQEMPPNNYNTQEQKGVKPTGPYSPIPNQWAQKQNPTQKKQQIQNKNPAFEKLPSEPLTPPPSTNFTNPPGNFKLPSHYQKSIHPNPSVTPIGKQTQIPASLLSSSGDIPSRIPLPAINIVEPTHNWVEPDFLKSSSELDKEGKRIKNVSSLLMSDK